MYVARCFFSSGNASLINEIKPALDGPISMIASLGNRSIPDCKHNPKFKALDNTDLPEPGRA